MTGARFSQFLVVEDLPQPREWLIACLGEVFGCKAHGAATLKEARAWLSRRPLEGRLLALVDLGLPDGNGIELIREIVDEDPGAMVVVSTIYEDDATLVQALSAGAQGYLLKDEDDRSVARRLALAEQGEVPVSPAIARRLLLQFRNDVPSAARLSSREIDVLRLIGRGLKSSEAAAVLGISQQTVTTHVKAIYRKLEIGSRAEAALEARRRGLT